MITNWIALAAFAGIGSNVLNFFSRYFLKDDEDSTSWGWFFETLRLIVFAAFLTFDYSFKFSFQAAFLLLLLGLSEFVSIYLTMKMHKFTHLSISSIISRTRMIWVPILAFLFLGEALKTSEYIGILILFIGLSIVVAPHKMFLDKGTIYANLAALSIAVTTIIIKTSTSFASTSVIMVAMSAPSAILFPLLMKNSKLRIKRTIQKKLFLKLTATFFNVVALILLIKALELSEASKVNAIYQGMMVTSVLAGIILLKERKDILKKLIGTAVVIVGMILLV